MKDLIPNEEFDLNVILVYAYPEGKHRFLFYSLEDKEINNGKSIKDCLKEGKAKEMLFDSKLDKYNQPGLIIKVKAKRTEESIRIRYNENVNESAGIWENAEDRTLWQTKAKLFRISEIKQKEAKIDLIKKHTDRLRAIYKELNYVERSYFIAEIINLVTK